MPRTDELVPLDDDGSWVLPLRKCDVERRDVPERCPALGQIDFNELAASVVVEYAQANLRL
jgi:hypothetical protein